MFVSQVTEHLQGGSLSSIILLACVVLYIVNAIRCRYRSGLRDLPGPLLAPYSEFWRLSLTAKGNAHKEYQKLHAKYGKIVRTGPDTVSIGDPNMIPVIYGFNNTYIKSSFYDVFTQVSEGATTYNIFSTQEPAEHRLLRSRIANKYSMTSLRELEPLVDECSDIFLSKMRNIANENPKASVDLGAWLQYYAFDVIGAITFQQHFGFMEKGEDVDDMISGIEAGLWYAGNVGNIKGLHQWLLGSPLVTRAMNLIPALRKASPIPKFIKITNDAINVYDRQDGHGENRADFLGWFRKEALKSKTSITHEELVNNLLLNLLAGSDTTAISLRAILYYLIKTPQAYKRLQQEVYGMESAGLLSNKVSFDESNKMPYLQASMKEAMRLHAGVGYPLERLVPEGGANLCGVHLPAGTRVGVNAWVVHMDTEIFGDDAAEYRPERWLESSPEQLKLMERSFLAFGSGTRTCIGKNISLLEMGKLVPEIFRNFDLEWTSPDCEWKVMTYWFAKQSGITVRCVPRSCKTVV